MPPASDPSTTLSASPGAPIRLAVGDITKAFPGVVANDHVTLDVRRGEVQALLGENGAGKTTLINILYGIYQPDAGEIFLDGRRVRIRTPHDAIALGIGMVPQHFLLVRQHTVAENVLLGLRGTRFLFPAREIETKIVTFADRYGLRVDPHAAIWQLSIGEQQRVEILKALLQGAEILILDEPTSVLTPQEATQLFAVLRRMKNEGKSVLFITHKLDEVMAVADRVTVLRKGRVVDTVPTAGVDKSALARMMVGREVEFQLPARRRSADGAMALVVDDLWVPGDRGLQAVRGVSLQVRRGEILGIAGVAGNGQRELIEAVAGLRRCNGRIAVLDHDIGEHTPHSLSQLGLAHIPEERVRVGIVPAMSVAENLVLRRYQDPPFAHGPFLDAASMGRFARQLIAEYSIQTSSVDAPARLLSGGNIQKLILARELSSHPGLIIAAYPTSGLDISATDQIHRLLLQRRDDGAGVLLVSEDLEELLTLSDRVSVLFGGEVMGTVPAIAVQRETLGLMMAGQQL